MSEIDAWGREPVVNKKISPPDKNRVVEIGGHTKITADGMFWRNPFTGNWEKLAPKPEKSWPESH